MSIGATQTRALHPSARFAPPERSSASRSFERILGRFNIRMAWAILVIAIIHPAHGTGIPICWLKGTTGVSCPGCGMTRSLSCAVRGNLTDSWNYHPFGIVLGIFLLAVCGFSLLGRARKAAVRDWITDRSSVTNVVYTIVIAAFLVFGAGRALQEIHLFG